MLDFQIVQNEILCAPRAVRAVLHHPWCTKNFSRAGKKNKFCWVQNTHSRSSQQNRLREDSARTPTGAGLRPRLQLREDSAQTPTGARLRPRLQPQGGLRPDAYGSWAPPPTSTAGKIRPDSYGSRTSHLTLIAGDSARTFTGAGLRPQHQLQEDSARTPTGARLRPRLRPQGGLRPDSHGNHIPSSAPTAVELQPTDPLLPDRLQ